MRAAVLEALGSPMTIDEVEQAPPGPGQVRVAVKYCGCCHSDLSIAEGSFPAPTPIILAVSPGALQQSLSDTDSGPGSRSSAAVDKASRVSGWWKMSSSCKSTASVAHRLAWR